MKSMLLAGAVLLAASITGSSAAIAMDGDSLDSCSALGLCAPSTSMLPTPTPSPGSIEALWNSASPFVWNSQTDSAANKDDPLTVLEDIASAWDEHALWIGKVKGAIGGAGTYYLMLTRQPQHLDNYTSWTLWIVHNDKVRQVTLGFDDVVAPIAGAP